MKPKYNNLEFKTDAEFKRWLDKTTYKIIEFKDNCQELRKIHIARTGEIIHCNLDPPIWNGTFVSQTALKEGSHIWFKSDTLLPGRDWVMMSYVVEKIQQL